MAWGSGNASEQRSVRVFTVHHESRFVLVRNVPALDVTEDLLKRLSLYGAIQTHRVVENDPLAEPFTQVVWVQYETVNNARHAKIKATQKPFFGSMLQIVYCPEHESKADTALKLRQRRELLQRRAHAPKPSAQPAPPPPVRAPVARPAGSIVLAKRPQHHRTSESDSVQESFIGPQLPPKDGQRKDASQVKPVNRPKRRRI